MDRAPHGTPLYVHLPFCAAKCHYCDFFSVPSEGRDVDGAIEAVLREAEERAPHAPRTVFLGGGTPSLLSVRQLARLLDGLDALTGFRDSSRETTLESNPESLDEEKARAALDLGVTRFSIGFQSLDDGVLRLFGRVHDTAASFSAYEGARRAGARSVSIDLIYATPGQSPAEWERDLRRVLALGPDHLSAYNLTYEEGTRFHLWLRQGKLEKLDEERELECLAIAREVCAEHGLRAYEISNHARPGHACRHNVNYWRNGPYLGLGPSAVSHVQHERAGNARSIEAWGRGVRERGSALEWRERLGAAERLAETWWLGLRLAQGVDPRRARRTAGFEGADDPALPVARELVRSGHLERRGARFRLSARGLPLADALAAKFFAAAPPAASQDAARAGAC